ncbi:MAG: helix-turn-helix domain-containing protein [Muribaculaceae bacterium]
MYDTLYLVQYTCFISTAILMILLIISRFHTKWINKTYETSRWLLIFAMFLLASHYVLQMVFGIRAKSDYIGALVNILFYTPVSILISYSIFHMECNARNRFKSRVTGIIAYLIILVMFVLGYTNNQIIQKPFALYGMHTVFMIYMLTSVVILVIIFNRKRKIIDQEIGGDIQSYINYTRAGFIILGGASLMATFTLYSRTLLFIAAPLFLISLVIFVCSFVALGYNIIPMRELLNNEDSDLLTFNNNSTVEPTDLSQTLSEERYAAIVSAIDQWCAEQGFRDSSITINALSKRTGIDRHELTIYLDQRYQCSFRIWLSDLRFNEAKRLMLEHPEFSNEAISAECGFSSHAQLYNIFRSKTGMSPKEWKENNFGK